MKKRTVFTVLMAGILVLTSCGAGDAVSDIDTAAAADTSSATETEAEKPEYTVPDADYGGAEFTFLDYDTDDYFWHAATYSDIHAEDENGDQLNDAQYQRNRKVEEELNIVLKTYPVGGVGRGDNAKEMRKLILAGENAVDVGFIFGQTSTTLLNEGGLLQNFYDIPTLNTSASWWDQNAVDSFDFDGTMRLMTGDISIFTQFSPMLYYFNKNLARDYKINDLYTLVRDGKWTYDKAFGYSRMVASDIDGNDKMDENDRYGMALQRRLVFEMLISGGSRIVDKDKNGKLGITLNSERTINIIEKCIPFLNEFETVSAADLYENAYSNPFFEMHIPMFKDNRVLFNFNQILIAYELRSMDADYGILPTPKFDEEQDRYYTSMSMSWATLLCIPATNDRLEMTGHVLDALGYYSQQMVTPAFVDQTVRIKALRDEDSAEMLDIVLANKTYDLGSIYDFGGIKTMLNNLGKTDSTDFASAYKAVESAAKTAFDKVFEGLS